MSIGNQEFGIPRKYQYQIGIWYLGMSQISWYFIGNLEYGRVKIWFTICIFSEE